MRVTGASHFKRRVQAGSSVLNWYLSEDICSSMTCHMSYWIPTTTNSWLGSELCFGIKKANCFHYILKNWMNPLASAKLQLVKNAFCQWILGLSLEHALSIHLIYCLTTDSEYWARQVQQEPSETAGDFNRCATFAQRKNSVKHP